MDEGFDGNRDLSQDWGGLTSKIYRRLVRIAFPRGTEARVDTL